MTEQRNRTSLPMVRPVREGDQSSWCEMCALFYRDAVPDRAEAVWDQVSDGNASTGSLVAEDAPGNLLGFANYILHPKLRLGKQVVYLEDLFVREQSRGEGVGFALISHLVALAEENGWARVYWHTRPGNVAAQRLYNRFSDPDDAIRYVIAVG